LPIGHSGTAKLVLLFLVLLWREASDWVQKFNDEKHYMPYINKGWDLKPKVLYNESLEDNNPYEGKLYNSSSGFPYDLKDMYTKNGVIRSTPFETIYWQSLP
jgi:hypothetical protein